MSKKKRAPAPPKAPPAAEQAPLSPGMRRLFTAITVALPFILLLLLEVGLRVAGYGESHPLFVRAEGRPEFMHPNPDVAKRYFPKGTIVPLPHLDFFRAERRPETFRIIFQGESSAAGFPYRHGGAPSRMLQQRLQATFPDRDIEVVNTALTADNSYTLLDLAGEVIAQRPDAVMIYTGHNEYYGVFGVGSSQSAGRARWLTKAYLRLRHLRIAQLMGSLFGRGAAPAGEGGEPRTVMELMAGDQRIPLGSARYREGVEQFRANLRELLGRYRAAGIPVFIGTVASNERDQPPFVSGLAPGTDSAAWGRAYRAGLEAMGRGDPAGAERALREAVRMDSTAADALYALGRVYNARGDAGRARVHYRAAKEADQLRFRAPEALNRVIREEAARHGATVVETQRALERAAPGGSIGGTLMLEHLHPNVDGYFLIADAFYEALRARRMIGPWTRPVLAAEARRAVPVTAADSLVGVFRADRVRSGWPFRPRGTRATPLVDTLQPRTPEEQLAQAMVGGSLPWPEAMDRLRGHYEQTGQWEQALRVARALAQEYRTEPRPLLDGGRIAYTLGRYDEALGWFQAANAREESSESLRLIGVILLRKNDHAAALAHLRRAAMLDPGDQRLAQALRAAEALPGLEQQRTRTPGDASLLYNLATVYALTYQYEKAKSTLADLRRVSPAHPGADRLQAQLPP